MFRKKEEINSYSQIITKLMKSELDRRKRRRGKARIDIRGPEGFIKKYPDFFKEEKMEDYIGTIMVKARPENWLTFKTKKENDGCPEKAESQLFNSLADGYAVEYPGGVKSWVPKNTFENTYRKPKDGLTFGEAIEALKSGARACRKGWNGKGMYIYLTPGSTVPRRDLTWHTAESLRGEISPTFSFNEHIDMKAADGTIVIGWLASQTDMLSEDWMIIE